MKKALIYGLTLTFALTLTACGQPKAEEPGEPDPAASAAVQTASPETTEPTATPEPFEETPAAPAETAEDKTTEPEDTIPEQPPETPGETESTQPTGETEPTTTAKPTTQPTKPSTSQTQTPPNGENPTYEEAEQAMIEAFGETSKKLEEEGYSSGHGNLTDEAMEAIGSSLSGGTPITQPDTDSQDGTDRPQTPPDSSSIESGNVRTPAQTAAEDWIRQQLTDGSSDYTGRRDFTEEEIADIGSKLNVTD